ncbi:methyl-accepting chemotaxis protein [Aliarcobacter cryaerophilus]|uniref:methyl-accepting chemotaxis protein n=1 Tax=Aliarcobacter cryaerophilus TaxID=28198 RepID=UPI00112F038C|nr:methyl-accepting chemotaxis protein [Aliarcobacter cryaerophilus]
MSKINNSFENSSSISDLVLTITKTSEQGLQVSNALRGIIINPDDTKAKENFIQAVKELDDLMLVLKDSTKKSQGFEKFEIAPLYASQIKVLNKIIEKIKNSEALTKEDNTLSTKEWRPLKAALLKWQERDLERNKKIKEELNKTVSSVTTFILIILLITILSILVTIQLITRNIVSSLNIFQNGLLSFFAFSNKESSNVELINLDGKDEFGKMAKVINENIKKSNEILLNEEQVLEQIEKMIQNIERGFFMYRIKLKCENQQIETIRNNINSLANNLQMKISSISNVLLDFGESHFESRVPEDLDMVGTYGSLKSSTSLVGNNASELLAMILTTGDKLNEEITILSASSQNLSINANEAASSLEETAASLEEITSNIRNNTQSIAKMSALSFNVTKSVKEGEELANQTTTAMDEINTQVNLVNEAISVIDNIAFQTNILSLNAAVEAATAGEAGKGFAVVAQEVRNLASRSAEAAKEIKDIVELATKKANEGKEIANSMIEGYKDLNSNVSQTVTLISDIEMASKEQLLGIEQINDAVNNLDAQTQQNAMVSNQINDLSREVSELSSKLVSAANLADYSKKTKDYICNVDLVFKTGKLKNDHIRFKENNFAKLGNNERWTVVSCNDCNLGKWIKESEQNQEKYTKTQSWNKLKDYHADLHNSVQKYIDEDVEVNSKVNLKDLAIDIEISTSHIFDELNMVKKNVCLEKPEIS